MNYVRHTLESAVLGQTVNLGILRPRGEVRASLYFFHGGNGDDRQVAEAGLVDRLPAGVLEQIEAAGIQIVLPFIGTSFLHGAWGESFYAEILPFAEADTVTTDGTRAIAGLSMGGQAALNVFLRDPSGFAAVGAHFPTLVAFDYTDEAAVAAFAARTGIATPMLDILVGGFKAVFANAAEFTQYNPIVLAKGLDRAALKDKTIYFDMGTLDDFGLQEGALALREALTALEVPHHFEFVTDGHHDLDFLVRQFPKLMNCLVGTLLERVEQVANLTTQAEGLEPSAQARGGRPGERVEIDSPALR